MLNEKMLIDRVLRAERGRKSRRADPYIELKARKEWVRKAASLRANAFRTAMALLEEAWREGTNQVLVYGEKLNEYRLTRDSKARGLKALQAAGLVRVKKQGRGKPVIVTLLGAL